MAKYHTVKQGECLATIAADNGFVDYHAIYDHPKNAALKAKRKNPDILLPGDVLYIPDKRQRDEPRGTGQQHIFQTPGPTVRLRVFLKDDQDNPVTGKPFTLDLGDAILSGTIGSDGLVEQPIPPGVRTARLRVVMTPGPQPSILEWKLEIGHLDPASTTTGAQGRLLNMGFDCGPIDGIHGPRTTNGLIEFQRKEGLPETGKLDAATISKLREIHDGDGG